MSLIDRLYYYDERAAQEAVDFFPRYVRHTKGEWRGRPFVLADWQSERIIRPLFGWKRKKDGFRRFRKVWLEVPKKNGKSLLASGVALKLTFADGEGAPEVYSAAADRKQAGIVFNAAREIVKAGPLRKVSRVYRQYIYNRRNGGEYHVLSSDVATKHGFNVHGLVMDEVHVQPNRELYDTLEKGTAARNQPVVFMVTTAGHDTNSLAGEMHVKAEKVLDDPEYDPTFLPVIFAIDEEAGEDYRDPAMWAKANPGYPISPKHDYLEEKVRDASQTPSEENSVKRLHFNVWTEQETRWLDVATWDANALEIPPLEELRGRKCFGGLDLSTTTDLSAFVLLFPPDKDETRWIVLPYFWIPKATAHDREKRGEGPISTWTRAGHLYVTPGDVIDYRAIRRKIGELRRLFRIVEIGYDRWNATETVTELSDEGLAMVPIGQGFASMAQPCRDLEAILTRGDLAHGGHPVLRHQAKHVTAAEDPAGNRKPDKASSKDRIDGIVALLMALARATVKGARKSVYASRGIQTT